MVTLFNAYLYIIFRQFIWSFVNFPIIIIDCLVRIEEIEEEPENVSDCYCSKQSSGRVHSDHHRHLVSLIETVPRTASADNKLSSIAFSDL